MPTRRQFLRRCSTAALTSMLPAAVFAGGSISGVVPLDKIPGATFSKHAGALFHVLEESGMGVFLRLIEVKPVLPSSSPNAARAEDVLNERFSLLFSGPSNRPLAQGSYVFENLGIGRFEMFIVPVGPQDSSPRYYEAVFNRPVGGATMPPGPVGKARPRK